MEYPLLDKGKNMIKDESYLNVVADDETPNEICPIVNRLKNKLLFCTGKDGRTFVSRLIAAKGDQLFFETKSGSIIINNINDIVSCSEFKKLQQQPEAI